MKRNAALALAVALVAGLLAACTGTPVGACMFAPQPIQIRYGGVHGYVDVNCSAPAKSFYAEFFIQQATAKRSKERIWTTIPDSVISTDVLPGSAGETFETSVTCQPGRYRVGWLVRIVGKKGDVHIGHGHGEPRRTVTCT